MTAALAAPTQTRPPHIDPRWWYRATWRARQTAIDNHNKTLRAAAEAERARIAQLRANVEAARAEHEARYRPTIDAPEPTPIRKLDADTVIATIDTLLARHDNPHLVAKELGIGIGALEARARRAGRTDLAAMFGSIRNKSRAHKPCACGRLMSRRSKACRVCTSRAMAARKAA